MSSSNQGIHGIVKWFNDAKGFGFIEHTSGRDVFVHYSVIESQGFKTLKDGEEVLYEISEGPKGLHAVRVQKLAADVEAVKETTAEGVIATEGASTDGASTDGASTDGASTEDEASLNFAQDGAAQDGAANNGEPQRTASSLKIEKESTSPESDSILPHTDSNASLGIHKSDL